MKTFRKAVVYKKLLKQTFAVVLAVWFVVWNACAYRVKWSVMTNICSYPPFDLSKLKKSMQTSSIGDDVAMFTRVLISAGVLLLMHRAQFLILSFTKLSIPGQKNLCLNNDNVLSRPWWPRSSCRLWNTICVMLLAKLIGCTLVHIFLSFGTKSPPLL